MHSILGRCYITTPKTLHKRSSVRGSNTGELEFCKIQLASHSLWRFFWSLSLSPPIIPSQLKVRCCCVVVRDAKVISVLISKLQRKQETYRKKEREQHTHRLLFVLCAASPKQTACSTRHRLHTRSGGVATLPLVASISHSRRHMTFFRSLCDYSVNIRRSALRCDGIYHAQSGARECTSASSVCITHARQKIW